MQTLSNTHTLHNLMPILDGNPILNGHSVFSIGSDTFILFNVLLNTLYICAHLKDFKPSEDSNGAFTKQMNVIIDIVNNNKDKQTILMMDANTQFKIEENTILVYSKNNEMARKKFVLDTGVKVSNIVSNFSTSNKMRGPHTAQLNKMLEPVSASIDHIIVFNGSTVINTTSYVINPVGILEQISNNNTLTTSSNSIVDHAFVVSTTSDGFSYATLNTKGGNPEDPAWAEFIPQNYYAFFKNPVVIEYLDKIALYTFKGHSLDTIKSKNFLSTPRCSIFDINVLEPPEITVDMDGNIYKDSMLFLYKDTNNNYVFHRTEDSNSEWNNIFLSDLNSNERREFLLTKGYLLLNYWHNVQNDKTVLLDGKSLSSIYKDWYNLSTKKTSIGTMVRMAKMVHQNLKVISLQEMPKDQSNASSILKDIEENNMSDNYSLSIHILDNVPGNTRGTIIVFTDK
jgi:hypothetical protein